MEGILEIRDTCKTPIELLTSDAFEKYLNTYKRLFIKQLQSRQNTEQKEEVLHKIYFIKSIDPNTYIKISQGKKPFPKDDLMLHRQCVKFIDGLFHHYRKKSYTRLIKLHDEILNSDESSESIKDRISKRAMKLSDLIIETRRILLTKVGLNVGVRRSQGLECQPNVSCGEISGNNIDLPGTYSSLNEVPITTHADMRTGIHYTTHANKRAFPFFALKHNPFKNEKFNPEEFVAIPFEVGQWNIIAYVHKSRGCVELEPGLLNLFPFSKDYI